MAMSMFIGMYEVEIGRVGRDRRVIGVKLMEMKGVEGEL